MIRCPSCLQKYESLTFSCPHCAFTPPVVKSFVSWAPEKAIDGIGFKAEYFETLARLEPDHFWFRARNRLILWLIKRYASECRSLLEIGCGTGYVLSGIAREFPECRLSGSELFVDALHFAHERLPDATLMQMDACSIPFAEEFDVIGAFDVLEHIEDDQAVLAGIYKALKPGGMIVISVPQHSWLWSSVDVHACHIRRYEQLEIADKLRTAGFRIIRSTSFLSLLLPLMMIVRRKAMSDDNYDPLEQFRFSKVTSGILEKILKIEHVMIRLGINFPLGGSRVIIAAKSSNFANSPG